MSDLKRISQQRYWCGILALAGVVFIWVSSSFAMNSLFGELSYNKPFLVTYLNTATFSLYLLPLLFKRLKSLLSATQLSKHQQSEVRIRFNKSRSNYAAIQHHNSSTSFDAITTVSKDTKLSTYDTIKLSLQFCILWFLANYTTNASLAYTSVGSSTILASMSGLFTLGIGAIFKVETMCMTKLMAVLISFIGVIFVSYSDHFTHNNNSGANSDFTSTTPQPLLPIDDPSQHQIITAPLIGDSLALLGAIFYGCYTTLLKLKIGNEDRIDMPLFFGFVGAFNVVLLWPLIPLFDYVGLESFQIPMNATLWIVIFLNAFIGTFLSDYLWLLSMLMTSPLVVTLGISLTIPLALLGDVVFKGIIPNLHYILGAMLVVVGFLAINTTAMKEAREETQDEILAAENEVL
ncbi:hypothetical protein BDF20DRAFT_819384 [Mycotypha africana]|uniref:uncharacterized protein n=1 Tax=Mycotypha africana TaxID=64632 RepID=UPI0022FFF335|nr:uncharacterized protein BDF20DRAFT_819384 [Mycotypha africana]KAI8979690.1 hypothetical protein BDF20DRAFT_819384 [Mycotypha africana]